LSREEREADGNNLRSLFDEHIHCVLGCIERMALNRGMALDNLARLVQVIRDDRQLQAWFCEVAQKSAVERRNEIYSMVERLKYEGEDADLAASFQLLADS
jgi:hypothetical protein